MKRQFLLRKSGFTLFELMLSISIMIIFFSAALTYNWNPRTDSEKSELISVSIAGQLRTEIQNISIGKMPKRDRRIAKMTIITLQTGSLLTEYMSGATLIDSKSFASPYFDGDAKYVIRSITWTGSSTPLSSSGKIIIEPTGMSFSGGSGNILNNTLLELRVGYNNATRKIVIDRRTGKISELKQ